MLNLTQNFLTLTIYIHINNTHTHTHTHMYICIYIKNIILCVHNIVVTKNNKN